MNFRQAYAAMWRGIWDYKGRADKREYWLPTFANGGLLLLAGALIWLGLAQEWTVVTFIGTVLLILTAVCTVPWVALTVRRMHGTGRSGAWAWLLLAVGVGTMIVLFLCSASVGGFTPEGNRPVAVYGPPEWFEGGFDPKNNQNVDVYGPPEWFNEKESEPEKADFDPKSNQPVCVYGPPEWFQNKGTEK